jgi:GT2 family glycosyltransferase
MDLSIIIVNYNTKGPISICLRSVFEQTRGIDFEVIVVDNASTDGSREEIALQFPRVKIVANSQNLGFAGANNRGIAEARGKFILLLNPDTEALNGAIVKTVQFMDTHPQAGIAGCKLLFRDRTVQHSVRSFPSVWNVFCETTFLYLLFSRIKIFDQYHLLHFDYTKESQVDWLSGAYLMIRREVLDTIGLLDEQFYMYAEEIDFCCRAKKEGFQVWYSPIGEIVHFWAGVNAVSRRAILWTSAAEMLYFQKHFLGIKKFLIICTKYIGIALRVVLYFLRGCFTFHRLSLIKSYYSLYTMYRLVATPWKYNHNSAEKVVPWSAR